MEIDKKILAKYYGKAVLEQLINEYTVKGYQVIKKYSYKHFIFDLMVKDANEIIIFEIKIGRWSKHGSKHIQMLRNIAVHDLGAKFKLIFVNIPQEPDIYIENLDSFLCELLAEECVNDLSQLSSNFRVEEVTDIEIEKFYLENDSYEIKGSGTACIELQYGSDLDNNNDNGLRWTDSNQFNFHIQITKDFSLEEVFELEIDIQE